MDATHMVSYPYQEGNGFSLTNKLDLLRVFVFARQVTASGAIPAGLLYLTTNSSKLVEIPQSVQFKFTKIMKKNKYVGVYAGVEPANYSLCIGSSLPFD
nr:MAG: hypothetical protein [Bacteriophage sp.]